MRIGTQSEPPQSSQKQMPGKAIENQTSLRGNSETSTGASATRRRTKASVGRQYMVLG